MNSLNFAGLAIENPESRLDAGCKQLFAARAIAAFLLTHCVPEYMGMSYEEINPLFVSDPVVDKEPLDDLPEKIRLRNSEDKSVNEGTVLYDVKFDIWLPGTEKKSKIIINIEAQGVYNPGYALLSRAAYYAARLISSQKQTIFHHSDYDSIEKVYTIWICINPDPGMEGVLNLFELKETCLCQEYHFKKEEYDKMGIIIVCLKDEESKNVLVRFLSTVLNDKKSKDEKLQSAQECGIKITKDVEGGIQKMCDYSSVVFNNGFDEGEAKGIAKTNAEAAIKVASAYLECGMNLNMAVKKVMQKFNLPKEKAEVAVAEAQKQL